MNRSKEIGPIDKRYKKLQKIGEGTYGDVFLAKDKRIPSTAIREISTLKEIEHESVVRLLNVFLHDHILWLVFEYLETDLHKDIERNGTIPAQLIKSYSKQILEGLVYCHKRRIIHRDLKPHNLLLDGQGGIKIADLGLVRTITVPIREYTPEVVTLWYRSPELLLGYLKYSFPVDLWSIGCIISEMNRKKPLFQGSSEVDQICKIFSCLGTPNEKTWPGITSLPNYPLNCPINHFRKSLLNPTADPLLGDLVVKLLHYDPSKRLSAQSALLHPYFS